MSDPAGRATLTRRAALASVAMATLLLGLKAYAARATGSVAMLGSLADTALDLLSSLVTLYAVGLAAQPADDDHRFGHGKAEAIAALMQTLVILGSAVAIGARAAMELGTRTPPARADLGIGVSLFAAALTLGLVAYQRHVVRRTGSIAIGTDQVHYEADLMLNLAVVVAFGARGVGRGCTGRTPCSASASRCTSPMARSASARAAIDMLMDREWPEAKRQSLLAVVARHPRVDGVHELRTRSSGVTDFIQFHVWLDPGMTVACAHDIVDEIEADVAATFPGAEILIHVDPLGHYDRPQVARSLRRMRIPFHQIDAFADRPFTGNPAAVMPLTEWLDDATLLAIAAENNLAETAFLVPRNDGVADYDLRWFAPACEIALCGHATLASGSWALARNRSLDAVTFSTRLAGVLTVARDGARYTLDLPARGPRPVDDADLVAATAAALGATPAELLMFGDDYLVAVFATAAEVRALRPDAGAVLALDTGPDLLLIATATGRRRAEPRRRRQPRVGVRGGDRRGPGHRLGALRDRAVLGRRGSGGPASARIRRARAAAMSPAASTAPG